MGESSVKCTFLSFCTCSFPVSSADRLAAGGSSDYPMCLVSPEMGPKGKQLSRSASVHDLLMDSSDERRKIQFVDDEDFTQPSNTTKVGQIEKVNPI